MSAVVLVVVMAASDVNDPSTAALMRVARDALGPGATVALREAAQTADDDAVLASVESIHPTAVAEVTWADAQHLRATLHVHVEGAPRWVDRQLGFEAIDAPSERGRTLGFALVSMLPERADALEPPTPPSPPPSITPPLREAPERSVVAVPPSGKPPRAAIEVAAIGAVATSGYGGGFGASVAGRWLFAPRVGVHLGAGIRAGEIAPAQASTLVVFGALGLVWDAWRPVPALTVGARADGMLVRQELAHLSADDPSAVREARWLGGADALVELSFAVSHNAGLFAGAGTELVFGESDVYVAGIQKAQVTVLRVVSELGARARF